MNTLDKRMIHDQSRMGPDSARFYYTTQNNLKLMNYPGIFQLVFLDCDQQVIETAERIQQGAGSLRRLIKLTNP